MKMKCAAYLLSLAALTTVPAFAQVHSKNADYADIQLEVYKSKMLDIYYGLENEILECDGSTADFNRFKKIPGIAKLATLAGKKDAAKLLAYIGAIENGSVAASKAFVDDAVEATIDDICGNFEDPEDPGDDFEDGFDDF